MHSQQQQMSPNDNNIEEEIKSFSIRQYVLSSRQKSIFHSWPFPEKYLHICLNHGVSNVLPPLDELNHSDTQSVRGCFSCSQEDDKKVDLCKSKMQEPSDDDHIEQQLLIKEELELCNDESKMSSQDLHLPLSSNRYKHEGENLVSCEISDIASTKTVSSVHWSNRALDSSKALRHKRKRGRKKSKKRSMVDILAVAKHCTLEDVCRIRRVCCAENEIEGKEQIAHTEKNSTSEITEEFLKNPERDDHEVADVDLLEKKKWDVKLKLMNVNSIHET
ncbi:Protein EMBRYONIC FLOWER 1-like protein [Quillaja saponaria]|uniref:Protein EMBRYONIC FLOWER 1-like protein n=1 Tax=Quillaja saponaria TaxID=32244 RepID=A0AAD7LHQ5_QUISA|nr:Protein EMBRYONIC FLOWER 1-like protein [Quillaja saponaria]